MPDTTPATATVTTMIPPDEARARILARLDALPAETVPLAQAAGRVVAASVAARLTQPPADVSAMDGYALRAADAVPGARLRVIGSAPAGQIFPGALGAGEALRLFTGSVVPAGADAVLLQEDALREGDIVSPTGPVRAHQHIRPRGQDFTEGQEILAAGTQLGPRQIGLAAAGNHAFLPVHRRARIAILTTGDEIVLPGETLPPGGIVSSNAFLLAAMVAEAGGEPVLLPRAPDQLDAITAAIAAARGFDLLVTTGGASVGDHDLIRPALARLGFAQDVAKVAMRPGKPMLAGALGPLYVLGLPGNPVSAAVCATLFLLPALARLHGVRDAAPRRVPALAGTSLRANDGRADHIRAVLSRNAAGQLVATPFPRQDSGLLSLLAQADCLILRAPLAPAEPCGATVPVIPLRPIAV